MCHSAALSAGSMPGELCLVLKHLLTPKRQCPPAAPPRPPVSGSREFTLRVCGRPFPGPFFSAQPCDARLAVSGSALRAWLQGPSTRRRASVLRSVLGLSRALSRGFPTFRRPVRSWSDIEHVCARHGDEDGFSLLDWKGVNY